MAGRLCRHVPNGRVVFKHPQSQTQVTGNVIDEIWAREPEDYPEVSVSAEEGWLESAFAAQLVDWGGGHLRIRFVYYTRRPGRGPADWVFAQFAPSLSLEDCQALLDKIQQKGWLNSALL